MDSELLKDRVTLISERITAVKQVLNACGFGQNSIAFNSKNLAVLDEKQFTSIYVWFDQFQKCVDYYYKVRKLVPEEQWKQYSQLKVKGLQEQRKLRVAKDIIREQWQKRPVHLKKETVKDARKRKAFRPK